MISIVQIFTPLTSSLKKNFPLKTRRKACSSYERLGKKGVNKYKQEDFVKLNSQYIPIYIY